MTVIKKILTSLSIMLVSITIFTGCDKINKMLTSNEELAEQVKETIIEEFKKDEIIKDKATVKSLTVVHEKDNKYSGILKTDVQGKTIKCDVDITFDGNIIKWEISKEEMKKIKLPLIFSDDDSSYDDDDF